MDCSVLTLLFLGLLVFQLDRIDLASALIDGFAQGINVNQDTINLGNQLMFTGIVVLEIPCNMALQRVSFPVIHCFDAKPFTGKVLMMSVPSWDLGSGCLRKSQCSDLLRECKCSCVTEPAFSWVDSFLG